MIDDETRIAYPNLVALVEKVGDDSPWYEKALYLLLIPRLDPFTDDWEERTQLERVEGILDRQALATQLSTQAPRESDCESDYPYLHRLLTKDGGIRISKKSDPFVIFGKGVLMTRAAANHIEQILSEYFKNQAKHD